MVEKMYIFFMKSARQSCLILIKLEFSRHIFENFLFIHFKRKNSVQWEPNLMFV